MSAWLRDATEGEPASLPSTEPTQPTKQVSMAFFFGMPTKISYEKVKLSDGKIIQVVKQSVTKQIDITTEIRTQHAACVKCGESFVVGAGLINHERACIAKFGTPSIRLVEGAEEEAMTAADGAADDGEGPEDPESETGGEDPESEDPESRTGSEPATDAGQGEASLKRQKVRKDGAFKQSGLHDGDRKGQARTILFKYEVVQHLRKLQGEVKYGTSLYPNDEVAAHYKVDKGQVSKWAKQEEVPRQALLHGNVIKGRGKRHDLRHKLVSFTSLAARRCSLGRGRGRKFAAAEEEVHSLYKEQNSASRTRSVPRGTKM